MLTVSTPTATTTTRASVISPLTKRLILTSVDESPTPPPLLSASSDLNIELYNFLALAFRAYVAPWWSKLTRYDKDFIPHVALILSGVIHTIGNRVSPADLPPFILTDIVSIVTKHYADYQTAVSKGDSSCTYGNGGASNYTQFFHQLQPHIAVDADGNIDPVYVRTMLDDVLHICLAEEDYDSDLERTIVLELFVKIILVDVAPKVVQPWFINKIILDLMNSATSKTPQPQNTSEADQPHPYKLYPLSLRNTLLRMMSAVHTITDLVLLLVSHLQQTRQVSQSTGIEVKPHPSSSRDYAPRLLNVFSILLTMPNRAASRAFLAFIELFAYFSNNLLNRLIPCLLSTHVFTEQRILDIFRSAQSALFPNGYPGPPIIEPPPEEQIRMKEEVMKRIEELIPSILRPLLLGSTPTARRVTIQSLLAPLSTPACTAHLFILFFDAILLALFPELSVSSDLDRDRRASVSLTGSGSSSLVIADTGSAVVDGESLSPPGSS